MSKLKWKWRKTQNTSFNAYKASGIYNYYYFYEDGKSYNVIAFTEDKGQTVKYKLTESHQKIYEPQTYYKELGTFDTILKTKLHAEELKGEQI